MKFKQRIRRFLVVSTAAIMLTGSLAACGGDTENTTKPTTTTTPSTTEPLESRSEVKRLSDLAAHLSIGKDDTLPAEFLTTRSASTSEASDLLASIQAFTQTSFKLMAERKEETNLLMSPLSLYLDLAMLAEGTAGNTRTEIVDALAAELNADGNFLEQYRAEMTSLLTGMNMSRGEFSMRAGQSLWFRPDIPIRDSYIDTLSAGYLAEVYHADFAKGATVVQDELDNWVSDKTEKLIETLGIQVKPDDVFYLLQTLYFKDAWLSQFTKDNNSEGDFIGPDGSTKTTTFMNQNMTASWGMRTEDFQAAELITEQGFSVRFILPNEVLDLDSILALDNVYESLFSDHNITQSTDLWSPGWSIDWSVPKFDVFGRIDLMDLLNDMGISDVMGPNADFSVAADVEPGTYNLSAAVQQVRIKVDEKGIEAAAVTVLGVSESAIIVNDEMDMILDRPFLFTVTTPSGLPMFISYVGDVG